MQFYYGDKMVLRVLDEIDFWKRQEGEHTVVIRQIVENLEEDYVKALQKWEEAFAETEGKAIRYTESVIRIGGGKIPPQIYSGIINLINFSVIQSKNFLQLLDQLISYSKAVKVNPVAIVVINHIRRESEYFIGIAQTALDN